MKEIKFRQFLAKTKNIMQELEYQISVGRWDYNIHTVKENLQMIEEYIKEMGDLEHPNAVKSLKYKEQKIPFYDNKG